MSSTYASTISLGNILTIASVLVGGAFHAGIAYAVLRNHESRISSLEKWRIKVAERNLSYEHSPNESS